MLGLVQRAAVKLDDDVDDELAVGEGVETCMAARMLGILRPGRSARSAISCIFRSLPASAGCA